MITPFKNDKVDYKALGNIIEIQIMNGINALLLIGTTGESPTITESERREITTYAKRIINGRVPLVIGIGGNNPKKIIEYGTWAKQDGADVVMVTAPYYNRTTQDGVVAYFNEIANNIKMPILAYNVPARTGMNIESATFAKIAKNKWIQGIKESSGNIEQIAHTICQCPNVAVYCGDDALSLPSYVVGAQGVVSVASNLEPKLVCGIYDQFKIKKIKSSRKVYQDLLPLFKKLFLQTNPIPVKYFMSKQGLCKNELRLPLVKMKD